MYRRLLLAFYACLLSGTFAFRALSSPTSRRPEHTCSEKVTTGRSTREPTVSLSMISNQFDVSNPVFDLFALRTIRGDALLRYNTLNQSEPLRINLYAFLAITLFSTPIISESVSGQQLGAFQTTTAVLGGIASMKLFIVECQKRSKQLNRIEKELNAEMLSIRLPASVLADRTFEKPQTLKALRASNSPPRLVAICGTASQLKAALEQLSFLGRRLNQASTFVVPVPVDGSSPAEWGIEKRSVPWLADAYSYDEWISYFDELADATSKLRWFGLNSNGRSFASGSGESPQWLELLGQHLRPTDVLDVSDSNVVDDDVASVVGAQTTFYDALTSGDIDKMTSICSGKQTKQVTDVIDAGGRIDGWSDCLAHGARPSDMQTSGADVFLVSDTEAYSTVVEFPANTGVDMATLLAVQQWTRDSKSDEWKLQLHQTIPWSMDSRAQGTLRCDCRGCVALTRVNERRSFGGLIG